MDWSFIKTLVCNFIRSPWGIYPKKHTIFTSFLYPSEPTISTTIYKLALQRRISYGNDDWLFLTLSFITISTCEYNLLSHLLIFMMLLIDFSFTTARLTSLLECQWLFKLLYLSCQKSLLEIVQKSPKQATLLNILHTSNLTALYLHQFFPQKNNLWPPN